MSNSKVDLMMVIIEPGRPGISKKKSEGDGSRAHGSRSNFCFKNVCTYVCA